MTQQLDILIIGGGISGLLTAQELRQAGREVTVIDQSAIGQESSWAGGGILLPIYPWRQAAAISELVAVSLQIYPTLAQTLLKATGIDPEWTACGMLICKNPDIDAAQTWCDSYQIAHQTAPAELLKPLNSDFQQPIWLPGIAQARNPRLLKALQAYVLQQGVKLLPNHAVTDIEISQQRISRVHTNQNSFRANQVLLCAGAWSAKLLQQWLPSSGIELAIQPVRGQMLLFDAKPETLSYMVLDNAHYLIPRRDGKILAGSTVEHAGFDKVTTEDAKQQLYQFATDLLPELKNHAVCQHWAGLRPGTPDGVPYIGWHPELENLAINAGHFRNGLVMGPASAQLLADLILQRPTSVNPAAYAITR